MGRKTKPLRNVSDRQLVDLLLANDEAAVEYFFFERSASMFTHVIDTIFQGKQEMKKGEMITDFYLFLRADDWRRLRQYQFKSRLDTWVTVVAIRYFNKKKILELTKKLELDPLMCNGIEQIPDDYDLLEEISKIELYDAIDHFPKPRERFALLGLLAGKSAKMVSKELGCSDLAVYNLIKRAKQTLKTKMKGTEE